MHSWAGLAPRGFAPASPPRFCLRGPLRRSGLSAKLTTEHSTSGSHMKPIAALCLLLATPAAAYAQGFADSWVAYAPASNQPQSALPISAANVEVDFAVGDLDQDGWSDVVALRGAPFYADGKRPNILLRNDQGTLKDESALFASASSVPGDVGFLTPTNDRDGVLVDVDGDGLLDVVTAAHLGAGEPKNISHPRVYRNLGNDGGGNWQGLRYEDARIPLLLSFTTGTPAAPNFNAVAAGDVNGDGMVDLYFADHDGAGPGGRPAGGDLNNRLLRNDGSGFFVDVSMQSMTPTALFSAFGNACAIVDLNGDSHADVLKHSYVNPPVQVAATYNSSTAPGVFPLHQVFHSGFACSGLAVGDLNGDARIDVVLPDDNADRFRLNTATDALGRAVWSNPQAFQFLAGGDDGFAGRSQVVDLDGDGLEDVLVADVEFLVPGFGRRLHVYHNRGNLPAGGLPELREERELPGAGGWIGAVGLAETDLVGTYDVAVIDVDRDGQKDILVGRSAGTVLWLNQAASCQTDLLGKAPGGPTLRVCGVTTAPAGATVRFSHNTPELPFVVSVGVVSTALPLLGGTFTHVPLAQTPLLVSDDNGRFEVPWLLTTQPADIHLQAVGFHGPQFQPRLSNGVRVEAP